MAAFATVEAAEQRAVEKMTDKTWVVAHSARQFDGTIAVRLQRFLSPTHPDYGAWVEVTSDASV